MVSSSERVAQVRPSVALVTGGGKGIGAAIAHRLAAQGSRVAVLGRDALALARVAKEIHGLAIEADVTDPEAMSRAIDAGGGDARPDRDRRRQRGHRRERGSQRDRRRDLGPGHGRQRDRAVPSRPRAPPQDGRGRVGALRLRRLERGARGVRLYERLLRLEARRRRAHARVRGRVRPRERDGERGVSRVRRHRDGLARRRRHRREDEALELRGAPRCSKSSPPSVA